MSLHQMILCSKWKNSLCKKVPKSKVVSKFNVTITRLHCTSVPRQQFSGLFSRKDSNMADNSRITGNVLYLEEKMEGFRKNSRQQLLQLETIIMIQVNVLCLSSLSLIFDPSSQIRFSQQFKSVHQQIGNTQKKQIHTYKPNKGISLTLIGMSYERKKNAHLQHHPGACFISLDELGRVSN